MNKRTYLTTIVYDSKGAEGTNEEMIPKLSDIIRGADGEVSKVQERGTFDFAYSRARKIKVGVYLQFEVLGDTSFPEKLKNTLKLEKKVDRVLIECKK